MTTESTPDLCCTHGEELVQRIEHVVELMEDVHAARVAKPRFAEGGYVEGPAQTVTFDPRRERIFTPEDFRGPKAQAVLKKLRDEVLARPSTRDAVTDHDGQHLGLATCGIVKAPEGHQPPIINRGCDYVISQEEAHRMGFNPTWNDPR